MSLNEFYNVIKLIYDLINKSEDVEAPRSLNFLKQGPFTRNQMKQGLILEMTYGSPGIIYTNIGEFHILGGSYEKNNGWEPILNILKDKLDLKLIKEAIDSDLGYYGPWYEIRKINNIILPRPIKKEKKDYLTWKECKEYWKEFIVNNNIFKKKQRKQILIL